MTEYAAYQNFSGDQYKATIQLDPYNSRARLVKYQGDPNKMIEVTKRICREHQFGKMICVVRPCDHRAFLENDLVPEGKIEGFFKGEDADFFSYFFDQERAHSEFLAKEDKIISDCAKYNQQGGLPEEPKELRTAQKEDAKKISHLLQSVFPDYPTPMDQPEYVKKMMNEDVLFKVIEVDGTLVSIASADRNRKFLNAEITDCATLPPFRGKGYLNALVLALERDLKSSGFLTSFSLARARSFGMNLVLKRRGYVYSGRHINNCRIMNGFEDMNIWVKRL